MKLAQILPAIIHYILENICLFDVDYVYSMWNKVRIMQFYLFKKCQIRTTLH